jgi:hypothetical protein
MHKGSFSLVMPLLAQSTSPSCKSTMALPHRCHTQLPILLRDLDDFAENYEDEALAYVQSFGFPFEGASNDPGVVVPYPDSYPCK